MSNPPLALTLSIWQGQTFNDSLTIQAPSGAPTDLTGYTARLMARTDVSDALPHITWGTTTGEIVLGGAAGTVTFNVPAATTAALLPTEDVTVWLYDLVLTSPTGVAERAAQGAMVIYPGITR